MCSKIREIKWEIYTKKVKERVLGFDIFRV
jgi:hypothetical protein